MTGSSTSVAIDASLWDEPTTGIGLYARCLYEALVRLGANVVRVGARRSGELPRGNMGRSLYTLGVLPGALAGLEAPVFHAVANFNLPLTRVAGKKLVLTVHDVIPEVLPRSVSTAYRWQFRLWLFRSLKVADRVVCVSERTRDNLLSRFPLPRDRVRVIYNGVDHVDRVAPLDRTGLCYLDALALPQDFVLYAGALDARKNVGLVLEACARLKAAGRKVTLVIAGQRWHGSLPVERRIAAMRAQGHDVRPLGYLAEPVFYALMRRAALFVFPSEYEGFGLPPLEAMRLGVTTIVSRAGALPEVCGAAAVRVDPADPEELASAMARLLASKQERAARSEAGRLHALRFTWEAAALSTLEVYGEVAGQFQE